MACCPAAEGALKYLDTLPTVAKERYRPYAVTRLFVHSCAYN